MSELSMKSNVSKQFLWIIGFWIHECVIHVVAVESIHNLTSHISGGYTMLKSSNTQIL